MQCQYIYTLFILDIYKCLYSSPFCLIFYLSGERNIHLDMNPWWWLESSPDILKGLETLQYRYKLDSSGGSGGSAMSDKAQAKKAAKAAVAVNEHQDFVRENNMVVQCMGRYRLL